MNPKDNPSNATSSPGSVEGREARGEPEHAQGAIPGEPKSVGLDRLEGHNQERVGVSGRELEDRRVRQPAGKCSVRGRQSRRSTREEPAKRGHASAGRQPGEDATAWRRVRRPRTPPTTNADNSAGQQAGTSKPKDQSKTNARPSGAGSRVPVPTRQMRATSKLRLRTRARQAKISSPLRRQETPRLRSQHATQHRQKLGTRLRNDRRTRPRAKKCGRIIQQSQCGRQHEAGRRAGQGQAAQTVGSPRQPIRPKPGQPNPAANRQGQQTQNATPRDAGLESDSANQPQFNESSFPGRKPGEAERSVAAKWVVSERHGEPANGWARSRESAPAGFGTAGAWDIRQSQEAARRWGH